jgi:hypothetical protein
MIGSIGAPFKLHGSSADFIGISIWWKSRYIGWNSRTRPPQLCGNRGEWVKGEDWIVKTMCLNIVSGLAVKWIPELCNGWTGKASPDSGTDKEPDIEQGSTAPVEEVSD